MPSLPGNAMRCGSRTMRGTGVDRSDEHDRREGVVVDDVLSCLSSDIDVLADQGPDGLDLDACEDVLEQIERATRRLSALQTRIVGAVAQRRMDAAAQAAERTGASKAAAAGRARRAVEDFLSDQLGISPTDARAATDEGRRRGTNQQLDQARDAGDVGPRQARLVSDYLEKLRTSATTKLDEDDLATLQAEAIEQAARLHSVDLSRWLRRRLGQIDPRRAEVDESIRHRQRTAAFTTTDDGMWRLSATLSGVDAGIATQAIEKFRLPDTHDVPEGQRRSPGQVTADAFVQMCRVALEADEASSTKAGARPHVVVTIDYQTLLDQAGMAEVERIGPVPFGEVRRLLADAGVARLLVDPEGVALEAGPEVRTVPAGLRRLLVNRDQGCVARGCSIPARWCQVAHLDEPFHLEGRLSPGNAALMCHHHHRRFDRHGWQIQWEADRPRLVAPPASTITERPERSTDDRGLAQRAQAQLPDDRPASRDDRDRSQHAQASPQGDRERPQQDQPRPPDPRAESPPPDEQQLPLFAREDRAPWDVRAGPRGHGSGGGNHRPPSRSALLVG